MNVTSRIMPVGGPLLPQFCCPKIDKMMEQYLQFTPQVHLHSTSLHFTPLHASGGHMSVRRTVNIR